MNWKLLLGVLLVLGIGTLLFLKFGPLNIIQGMLALISTQQTSSIPFPIELVTKAEAFYGQKYEVSFSPTGLNIGKISLSNVEGEVRRFKNNQWFSQSLHNGTLEIDNFAGSISIDTNTSSIILRGYASRVRGTNFEGSIFEWVG
jgi:hypothetical protein